MKIVDQLADAPIVPGGVDVDRPVDDTGNWIRQRTSKLVDPAAPTGQRLRDENAETGDVRPGGDLARADRDPEVRQVGVAFVVEQDVVRVDVAVYHAGAVRCLEGVAQLIDHRHGLGGGERAVFEDGGKVPAAHETHDQIGRVRLTPIVVQRDDVWMLERRDDLCFGLETADEGRIVGEVGTDDLDRHLATDGGLVGAVGRPRRTCTDLLPQLVPTHCWPGLRHRAPHGCAGSDLERLVPGDDLLLELAKPRRRLDTELLTEP